MNRILGNLICSFIPSKKKRHDFRLKHFIKIVGEKISISGLTKRSLGRQHNQFMFDVFQNLVYLKKENTPWDLKKYLEQIKNPPEYLCVDETHNYLNILLKTPSFHYSIDKVPNDKVVLSWEIRPTKSHLDTMTFALMMNEDLLYVGDSFLRSINNHSDAKAELKYQKGISFTFDDLTCYFDATRPSRMEQMLNDPNLTFTEEQLNRARLCIDKIVKNYLTKYNFQPIYTPNIGRDGHKKVLVIDQSYGDMSVLKGWGSEALFNEMLQTAIDENPDADIIVKKHPDTIAGGKSGYYTGLVPHDNVYVQTEAINPISLIQYCDKIYVCTTQFGFESLMCGKETHVFGMPFYAGWGATIDKQKCDRRTNKRTLEEIFYIAYILYSFYVNPNTGKQCEIEEAMDYLINLREEYFREKENLELK